MAYKTIQSIYAQADAIKRKLIVEFNANETEMETLVRKNDRDSIVRYHLLKLRNERITNRIQVVTTLALNYALNVSLNRGYGWNIDKAMDDCVMSTREERMYRNLED